MSRAISVLHGEFGRAAIYALDRPVGTHAHREGHLAFFLGGEPGGMTVGKSSAFITPDHAVAVSPWQPHSFDSELKDDACLCRVLYIKPVWFLDNTSSAPLPLSFGASQLRITREIHETTQRLVGVLLDDDSHDLFEGLLYELTNASFRATWSSKPAPDPMEMARWRFSDHRVRRAARLMQENYAVDTEMSDVARESGLSRPHFFKLFKKQMGVTPNVYMNTLRSEQAIRELLTRDKTVTDIAFDLGFSSQASFTRFFTTNVGIPPSEYRRVAHIF